MVTYSSSFLKFLRESDCKVAKALYAAYDNIYYYPAYKLMITNEEIDYLTFRADGTISYLPHGKEHKTNDNGDWAREGRQKGKAAKVIRKLFTSKAVKLFKDADFECFSNSYKAEFNESGYKLELKSNLSIPSVYDMERCEGDGSLQGSCMNNDAEYLSIYKYCDKLSILTLTNKENLLAGRALIWKINDEITLMDRVYVTHDWQYDLFINHAKQNKYWYKAHYKTYDYKDSFINLSGEVVEKTFKIYTNTDFDYYPYIDTFTYGDDGMLTNICSYTQYEYRNTDGTRDGGEENHDDEIYDEIDEQYICEDDAIQIERGEHRGEYTHVNNTVEVNGCTYWSESDDIVCLDGNYHLSEDVVYSEFHSEDLLCDDAVYSEYHSSYIIEDESVEIDNEYYHEDDDCIIEVNNTWYLKTDDNLVEIDGDYYEKDSEEIEEDEDGNFILKTIEIQD